MLRAILIDGTPGETARYTASDTAQSLPAAVITVAGKVAVGFFLTVESNPIRVAFGGADPTQGVGALGNVLNVGDVLRLQGSSVLSTFKYINANNGANGVLQLTPLYTP